MNQEVHNYLTIANQSCCGYPLQVMPTIVHQHYLAMKNGPSDLLLGSYDSLQCAKHCTTLNYMDYVFFFLKFVIIS